MITGYPEPDIDQFDDINFDVLLERLEIADFYPCCGVRLLGEVRVALRFQSVVFINADRVIAALIKRGDIIPVQWRHPRISGPPRTSYYPRGSNPTVQPGA